MSLKQVKNKQTNMKHEHNALLLMLIVSTWTLNHTQTAVFGFKTFSKNLCNFQKTLTPVCL